MGPRRVARLYDRGSVPAVLHRDTYHHYMVREAYGSASGWREFGSEHEARLAAERHTSARNMPLDSITYLPSCCQ